MSKPSSLQRSLASITSYKVIVEKSTVPVYTNEWIHRVLHRHGVDPKSFDVVSNPEFLREGTAVIDFLHPDRIVIGANTDRAAVLLRRIFEPLTAGTYYEKDGALGGMCSAANPAKIVVTSAQSAEIIKHASNAFLALKISFINAVANLAEAVDADIEDIALGMGLDSRIGPKFLRAGLGYGGSCFTKDVAAFHWVAQQHGVNLLQLLQEIRKINETCRKISSSTRCSLRCGPCAAKSSRPSASPSKAKRHRRHPRDFRPRDLRHQKALLEAGTTVTAYDPAAVTNAPKAVLLASRAEKMRYMPMTCMRLQRTRTPC